MRTLLIPVVLCLGLLLILGLLYMALVYWEPADTLTLALPQRARNAVSQGILAQAKFEARDFPAARRAVKLNPASEEAWIMYCATGVRDGTDVAGALQACARVASITTSWFHSQVIAEAYEEAHQPCEGLPVLKKTMGKENVSNISPIFSVARLEVTCGHMEDAERHLRTVVALRQEGLRSNNWEDRPPGADGTPDTYEKAFRVYLSESRQNLSALLTLRQKDAEALRECRFALGIELKQCSCQFGARERIACSTSPSKSSVGMMDPRH